MICRLVALAAALLLSFAGRIGAQQAAASAFDPALCKPLAWRDLGPRRGGRCAAVCGVPGQRQVYWFGSTGGGVWKSTDAGASWQNMSDGTFGGSIGAIAVAPSDPNIVYVGGGEKTVRGNVSHGDGMWKSTDAGRTWKPIGLADARHICRVRVHPSNPDVVYAAALGHLFGPNAERGVFRSVDGGVNWQRVLHANDDAGAVDLAMDPTNPRVLYAALWRVRRTPWSLASGGEGSGIWKSTDSGDTWTELTRNDGLPKGPIGICGLAVSPADADTVYAIVEAEDGGVFRSHDAGKTWTKTNSERSLRQRAWYYTRIHADPADRDVVYVLNVEFHRSADGGRTFATIAVPHGDNHDLWLDPADPQRMIEGNDGGACVSEDGGRTWSTLSNQPTAQMYRVSVDSAFPYRVLGAQQDNSALRLRSRSVSGEPAFEVTAGGESGWIVAQPDQPDIVYGGSYGGYLQRLDHRTGERRAVDPWPDNPMGHGAEDARYRFQWNFPLFFSPHDAHTLYAGAQVLFRTRDGGSSWQAISPDLTRNDPAKLGPSGGPITKDNTSVEYYCTIFAGFESPHDEGVLWMGSDDGLVHLSRDDGASWQNITPPDLPADTLINDLVSDPFERQGAYLAATRYKSDDLTPILYRTKDWGQTWTKIVAGIEPTHFTRTIVADPGQRGLLFAGTERGVYVSFNDGDRWQPLGLGLPIVPVTDLVVHERDLVAATQGRGFWVLEDLSVLQQFGAKVTNATAHLFVPRPAHRMISGTSAATVWYWLGSDVKPETDVRLEIKDASGALVRTLRRKVTPKTPTDKPGEQQPDDDDREAPRILTADKGLNRLDWDLRYAAAEGLPDSVLWSGNPPGPRAIPGDYQATLIVDDWQAKVPLRILTDPRSTATAADSQAQLQFLLEGRDRLTEVHRAIRRIRSARAQVVALQQRAGDASETKDVAEQAKDLLAKLARVEEALHQTKSKSGQDPLNFPIRLNDKLAGLLAHVAASDQAPTTQALEVRGKLVAEIDRELATLAALWSVDLERLNRAAATVPAVVPEPRSRR